MKPKKRLLTSSSTKNTLLILPEQGETLSALDFLEEESPHLMRMLVSLQGDLEFLLQAYLEDRLTSDARFRKQWGARLSGRIEHISILSATLSVNEDTDAELVRFHLSDAPSNTFGLTIPLKHLYDNRIELQLKWEGQTAVANWIRESADLEKGT